MSNNTTISRAARQPGSCPPFATEFTVTIFKDVYAATKQQMRVTFARLHQGIKKPSARSKEKLPWIKLATFGDSLTDNGSLRHDANVKSISGVEVDYDGGAIRIPFKKAVATIRENKLNAILYTSPSHLRVTESNPTGGPRWRILLPTSKELPPNQRAKLVARVNGLFHGQLGSESFTLSQAYYFGHARDNPIYQVVAVDTGDYIDQRHDLDATAIGAEKAASPTADPKPNGALRGDRAEIEDACEFIKNDGKVPDWNKWVRRFMMPLYGASGGAPWGLALAHQLSAQHDSYDPEEVEEKWKRMKKSPPNRIGAGAIRHLARLNGWHDGIDVLRCFDAHSPKPPREEVGEELDEKLEMISADSLKPKKTDWLWLDWLARGELNLMAGDSGMAKSTICMNLAARITTGGRKPDRTGSFDAGKVVMWTGEDSLEKTLLPRFSAAGGNSRNMFFVGPMEKEGAKRAFDPATDIPLLVNAVRKLGNVQLIILDPIINAITGDSHKAAEVRRDLQAVVDMAHETGAAVLGVTHFGKDSNRGSKLRVLGSSAFTQLPRHVLVALRNHEVGGYHWLARVKSNLGKDYGGLQYKSIDASVPGQNFKARTIKWGSYEPNMSVREMEEIEQMPVEDTRLEDAKLFLRMNLPMSSKKLREEAEASGHAWATMRRAKDEMGVISEPPKKVGIKGGGWTWRLPELA